MLVQLDGDSDGCMQSRLLSMGAKVLSPPAFDASSVASDGYRACLCLAWYLIVGRKHQKGDKLFDSTVYVLGGPDTLNINGSLLNLSEPYRSSRARLLSLLKKAFVPDAYILTQRDSDERSRMLSLPVYKAREINARYWQCYRHYMSVCDRVFFV